MKPTNRHHLFARQFEQISSFNRPARLFLLATVLDGVVLSAWWLFFNFYILERGFSREFLGMVQAAPSIASLILGIPLGVLSDRIGRKRAMLLGVGGYIIAAAVEVLALEPTIILSAAFLGGGFSMLYFISQAPFMMKVSTTQNRTMLFSMNFGLVTLAGSVGNLLAGRLPELFASWLGVPVGSALAYQAVLLLAVALSSLTLIPLALIREPNKTPQILYETQPLTEPAQAANPAKKRPGRSRLVYVLTKKTTIKLAFPNLLIGFGAAVLIPYINVFFRDKFAISDQTLGVLFSLSALLTGLGSILGPRLEDALGTKIRAIVLTQGASLFFLLTMGFSPYLGLAALGFLMRGTLMNMAVPLYNAFSMEQVVENEQATVNSAKELAWQMGWAVGPYLSGVVQATYGFSPLFIFTSILYALSIMTTWVFFHNWEKPLAVAPLPGEG